MIHADLPCQSMGCGFLSGGMAVADPAAAPIPVGTECRSSAVRGKKRHSIHGGKAGAPVGNRNAYRHGMRSAAVGEVSRLIRQLNSGIEEAA